MGPGLLGQLIEMNPDEHIEHQACLRSHAPLAEQADALVADLQAGSVIEWRYTQGLVCAARHLLRNQVVYGPPRRSAIGGMGKLPHGGFKERDGFADSRFCAVCHQFDEDGYVLNGKLLENTQLPG